MNPFPDTFLEDELLKGQDFSNLDLTDHIVRDCKFVECDFSASVLDQSQFSRCEFKECNFSNVQLNNVKLADVDFVQCKLAGVDFSVCNSLLFSINLKQCRAVYCIFAGINLAGRDFSGTELQDCVVERTDLSDAVFTRANLRGTTFDQVNLEGADLREAMHMAINPLQNRVVNMRISPSEAVGFVSYLGIQVD